MQACIVNYLILLGYSEFSLGISRTATFCLLPCSSGFSSMKISHLFSLRKLFVPSKTDSIILLIRDIKVQFHESYREIIREILIISNFSLKPPRYCYVTSVNCKISEYLTNAYSFPKPRSFVILNITTKILGTLNLNMKYQSNLRGKIFVSASHLAKL